MITSQQGSENREEIIFIPNDWIIVFTEWVPEETMNKGNSENHKTKPTDTGERDSLWTFGLIWPWLSGNYSDKNISSWKVFKSCKEKYVEKNIVQVKSRIITFLMQQQQKK